MESDDTASVKADLLGPGDGERWIVGEYDRNPLHIHLPPAMVGRLADGAAVRDEHLTRLAAVVTRKIERGEGRFGRRHPDGQGMLVLTLHEDDWDERP